MGRSNSKRSKRNKANKQPQQPLIVGPNYVQVLQAGNQLFLNKQVTLVLCGESHEDAIDVTRSGGKFEGKEGWIELQEAAVCSAAASSLRQRATAAYFRMLGSTKKSLPVEKVKEWSKQRIEEDEEVYESGPIVLLWVPDEQPSKVLKGKGYLLEFCRDKDDIDSDDGVQWIKVNDTTPSHVPNAISEWLSSSQSSCRAFEWADLDAQAHALNQRRLSDEDISVQEIDAIVHQRKMERKKQGIVTWDDWLASILLAERDSSAEGSDAGKTKIAIHLVLEAAVPPWELQLHRPTQVEKQHLLVAAPDYIRCVSADEEDEEEGDPSSDGIGSYMDFVYRRFMTEMLLSNNKDNNMSSSWVHCVDTRDLGCQTACHTDAVKKRWSDLLLPDERATLQTDKLSRTKFQALELDATGKMVKFVPEPQLNPERLELETLQAKGLLTVDKGVEDDESDEDEDEDDFTFPSFEGFFGQATDSLYYSPHVKLSYSPFLAKCVGSLPKWEQFFTLLFMGGSITEALNVLDLDEHRDAVHVRSPILQAWNAGLEAFEYRRRDDGEHYITYPFFPHIFYLAAAATDSDSSTAVEQQRTWSSQLFSKLCENDDGGANGDASTITTCKQVAMVARDFTLDSIQRHSDDPKGSDDVHCGGEWFEAYLRANHRDIYDDVDRSDASVLLRKRFMKSESEYGRKYNIGEIQIPSTKAGFDEITDRLSKLPTTKSEQLVNPRVECMAKILIDVWMSNLVDFGTILKVAEVVSESKSDRVIVVCYLGSAHARAVADFYVNRMGFTKKAFVGKLDWDENEARTIQLPSCLWNVSELFKGE